MKLKVKTSRQSSVSPGCDQSTHSQAESHGRIVPSPWRVSTEMLPQPGRNARRADAPAGATRSCRTSGGRGVERLPRAATRFQQNNQVNFSLPRWRYPGIGQSAFTSVTSGQVKTQSHTVVPADRVNQSDSTPR